jgi:hypothetical protein
MLTVGQERVVGGQTLIYSAEGEERWERQPCQEAGGRC